MDLAQIRLVRVLGDPRPMLDGLPRVGVAFHAPACDESDFIVPGFAECVRRAYADGDNRSVQVAFLAWLRFHGFMVP